MCDRKLKECKYCKNNTLLVDFLGINPETGNRLFSVSCLTGCTDYIYSFNPKTKEYFRTINMNRKVKKNENTLI